MAKKSSCLASRLAKSRRHFGPILVAVVANDRSCHPSVRSRHEDDLDDLHPLNYISHVAYYMEKIPRKCVPSYIRERRRDRHGRGVRAIDPYEINCWEPIEDDKSLLFLANHATRGEGNGDY